MIINIVFYSFFEKVHSEKTVIRNHFILGSLYNLSPIIPILKCVCDFTFCVVCVQYKYVYNRPNDDVFDYVLMRYRIRIIIHPDARGTMEIIIFSIHSVDLLLQF